MTLTRRITDIQNPLIRISLWMPYFTFYLIPDTLMSAWFDRHDGAPPIFSKRMLMFLWNTFLFGIDGTHDLFKD